MNDLTPQLEKIMENAKRVVLSHAEKDTVRAHVEEFVREHPVRRGLIPSPWMAGRFLMVLHKPVAFTLILLLVLGGGTAYAAEGALPGDTLYSIKVNVVEEVLAVVTVSDEAKVRWDARRAERRLEEATQLTDEGKMTDEKQAEIQERFEHLAQAVEERSRRVEEKRGPRAAATLLSDFEGKLRGHERALARADKALPAVAARRLKADVKTSAEITVTAAAPTVMMATMSESTSTDDNAIEAPEVQEDVSMHDEEKSEDVTEILEIDTVATAPIVKTVHARLKKLEKIRLGVELKEKSQDE